MLEVFALLGVLGEGLAQFLYMERRPTGHHGLPPLYSLQHSITYSRRRVHRYQGPISHAQQASFTYKTTGSNDGGWNKG